MASLSKDPSSTTHNTVETRKEKREEKREARRELRKLEGPAVSYQSKEQFAIDFGVLPDVTWSRTKYFDEATFEKDGQTTTAYYDIMNNLVGTTAVKTFSDVPVAGQHYIQKKYKDYTIEKVILFDDNEANETDMLLFGEPFDDADNYFVELQKDNKQIIVRVDSSGSVFYFTTLK
ncbi:hypothetical protein [Paraflavitalea sp. CAU 1676]|uniref:hypothetical protein n=1 Tax=Paraflavitalea sp. CAU 1676 TaxID=3032598 RepID=UPI0023DBCB95|nr:hypothetical protein [Paraflavitalea sp. CAU 1676]MDF2192429.1 hypothetical protein [Paraflavitalea sp. CAU 1676]